MVKGDFLIEIVVDSEFSSNMPTIFLLYIFNTLCAGDWYTLKTNFGFGHLFLFASKCQWNIYFF